MRSIKSVLVLDWIGLKIWDRTQENHVEIDFTPTVKIQVAILTALVLFLCNMS